jgi:hypothetical protein
MRAFIKALVRDSSGKPLETLTIVIGTISVFFLAWQLFDLNETLESQAYNTLTTGLVELDKISIDNSEFRPYFVGDKALPTEPEQRQTLWALADAKLDFFDSFYSQESHINWSRYTKSGWEEYFKESFRCSVVLRESFCRDQTQYGKSLRAFTLRAFPGGICDGSAPKTLAKSGECSPDR